MRGIIVTGILLASAISAHGAEKPLESYYARLSAEDHFNSAGKRLTSAAAIIRQDRANYHVYGKRDQEDEPDYTFSSKENRARFERMAAKGKFYDGTEKAILNGTPLIYVEIYEDYVIVSVREN
ncbi:hypothetical protein HNQ68_001869 [Pseudochrobactrum saccharolyticum]|uniref:Uncharacterized protein n=1 Tax=Pseudochrobactrum saccharolyticum TaxID=354352 RepID=A0A7W8ALL9_9HYPH|nr:hypothetical protein [Pseudochrobactrum saccharolyticum]KAB0538100.1 hypothetical protein F7P81_10250 [Pseudochrobactrum saccharolyticum]MBB5091328.1 hypothetical protein [Pseudochrobactrum saccharolyticum]